MTEFISVIATTRDNPEALDQCLRSLARQTDRNFEIAVADDGSGINTARVILDWLPRLAVPLKHAWHEKRGIRVGKIRNRGLRISAGTYCVFLDGDCVVLPEFVAAHRRLMEPGRFVAAPRLPLSRRLSERMMIDGREFGDGGPGPWLAGRWRGDRDHVSPLPMSLLHMLRRLRPWLGMSSGSMAFWRRDLDAVDGFECDLGDPAANAADIFIRLGRHGVRRKDAGVAAAAFQLWHPQRNEATPADAGRAAALATGARAVHGLSQIVREIEQGWRAADRPILPQGEHHRTAPA